ncbi:MAG: Arginine N-succinyltransferase [Myxococcaceae bacterium]|jgi:arginine N-succinyltransferase|nr:Arginine N-succinyltransferase [Myxococcaceae bacterium]
MLRYEIRGALASDEDQLLELAHHLNTVNLPDDRESVATILDIASKSFTGAIKDPKRREYVFVLVDAEKKHLVGTSMIIAQLGRRDAPYIYLDVIDEERYSATLDRHFKHTALSIGYSYNGPTEIGGLILRPEYRRVEERLGQFISYVRFLYMKMHRELFRDEILAELLPPLEADGTSHLWDALGRHFTGLTYAEADLLSKKNKEFIRSLFPEGTIYASLLPKQAQDVIGKVGTQTRGVEKMLRRIGFRYAERVDPFDGGPHFTAPTDEISLVMRTHKAVITKIAPKPEAGKRKALIAVNLPVAPYFRAVLGFYWEDEPGGASIDAGAATHLGLELGSEIWVLPLD